MKKVIFFLLFALCSAGTFAQKGSWYVGGQVGFNSGSEEETNESEITTTSWSVAPEIGTFLSNDLQLGFALNLSGSTEEQDTFKTTTSNFAPVIYLRNFHKVTEQFSVFAGIVASYTTGTVEFPGGESTISGWSANLSIGAAYALTNRFTAVAQYGLLGYTSQTMESGSNETTTTNFGLNINSLGPVFNVGIYYTISQ
ncbi:MAG: outer membrane beta-barrel protein [Ignavibacteriales bacterium]